MSQLTIQPLSIGQALCVGALALATLCPLSRAQSVNEPGSSSLPPVQATADGTAEPRDPCAITITSDDAYRFIPSHIDVSKQCKAFTVTLKHVGRLPKAAMGHNWVLVKKSDMSGVAADGMAAGESAQYLAPGDRRVIAATSVIGAGQITQVTFNPGLLQANETYAFLCTFGGHSPLMQGTIRLVPNP